MDGFNDDVVWVPKMMLLLRGAVPRASRRAARNASTDVLHSTAVAADPRLDPFLGQRQVQTRAAAQAQSAPQDYESSALLFPSAVGAQPNPVEATVVVVDAMFALRLPGTPLVRPAPHKQPCAQFHSHPASCTAGVQREGAYHRPGSRRLVAERGGLAALPRRLLVGGPLL